MATDPGGPGVPTVINLKDAQAALKTFQDLQSAITRSQNDDGVAALPNTMSLQSAVGPMIGGAGAKINSYYAARAGAVQGATSACQQGVTSIVTLLQASIAQYQAHEQATAASAHNTGTGGSSSSSSTSSTTTSGTSFGSKG